MLFQTKYIHSTFNAGGRFTSSVEEYQLGNSSSTTRPSMTTPRSEHACSLFTKNNGDITLIVSGGGTSGGNLVSVETLTKTSAGWGSWSKISDLPGEEYFRHVMVYSGELLYIIGGHSSSSAQEDSILESADGGTTWTTSTTSLATGREQPTVVPTNFLCQWRLMERF